jgi:hypothetical protein
VSTGDGYNLPTGGTGGGFGGNGSGGGTGGGGAGLGGDGFCGIGWAFCHVERSRDISYFYFVLTVQKTTRDSSTPLGMTNYWSGLP